jgi:hypothetical protein
LKRLAALLRLLALWTLAVGEPLLRSVRQQLVSSSAPDIFVGQSRGTVVAFAVLVLVVPPFLIWSVVCVVDALNPRVGSWTLLLAVLGLLVALALSVIGDLRGYLSAWLLVPAVAVGLALTRLYAASAVARTFVTVLAIAPLLALPLFLFRAPVSGLILSSAPSSQSAERGGPPITIVVLAEFPLVTLEDARGRIDARRFPNFAALARDGTWYRHATTVHDYTNKAVPAIATGRLAGPESLPYWFDHKRSLFTELNGVMELRAWESSEDLCPDGLCHDAPRDKPALVRLLEGAVRIRARVLTNGRVGRRPYEDPATVMNQFILSLHPRRGSGLEYLHVLLPHEPYVHLASGRRYGDPYAAQPGLDAGDVWTADPRGPSLSRHRLVQQTEYLDALIGRLIRRLRTLGDYDPGLLVVMADHGAAFVPGQPRRTVEPSQVHEIAPVPLFVKYPHQRSGGPSDALAQTIDVLPTVLRAAGRGVPSWIQGKPLQSGGSGGSVVTVHHSVVDLPPVHIGRARLERRLSADAARSCPRAARCAR